MRSYVWKTKYGWQVDLFEGERQMGEFVYRRRRDAYEKAKMAANIMPHKPAARPRFN